MIIIQFTIIMGWINKYYSVHTLRWDGYIIITGYIITGAERLALSLESRINLQSHCA